ncbi:hypothetical protein XELAEV_18047124mg [Xenopus laevis]|uniref:GIY-YIG domain-containing protein n=1 Tax=Xenopus laevis TaxID=8355 RepID=A0A974H1L2_XENLA|nr:hypothetical protein XELAEV_18047124mg [Xenopus laevis]
MAYKRNKNLKDLLVRADIGNSFTHPHTGKNISINKYYTCESRYVVYLNKCPSGLAYVGETTQNVKERIKQHKSNIRCKLLHLPIPAHFHEMKHTVSQLRYQVIDNV